VIRGEIYSGIIMENINNNKKYANATKLPLAFEIGIKNVT